MGVEISLSEREKVKKKKAGGKGDETQSEIQLLSVMFFL